MLVNYAEILLFINDHIRIFKHLVKFSFITLCNLEREFSFHKITVRWHANCKQMLSVQLKGWGIISHYFAARCCGLGAALCSCVKVQKTQILSQATAVISIKYQMPR